MTEIRFETDGGTVYSYDPAQPIGPRGAYGQVFAGHDSDGRPVAVKRVMVSGTSTQRRHDEQVLAEREVNVAKRLGGHPNSHLVPILDTAHTEAELLLVMPRGSESLADHIAKHGPMSSDETIDVLRQVTLGMQELAAESVVHRDIKPGNILRLGGKWCVSDFGVSRITTEATATLTWVGTGTLEYRAPELWQGDPERVSSDLYALGCVAHEMLTARPAFPGPDFREQHAVRFPDLPNDVDPALRNVVQSLLAKRPASRPPDARRVHEMLSRLEGLTSGQRALQRMQARWVDRQTAASREEAMATQQRERQQEAYKVLDNLWREVVAFAQQAVPGASTEGFKITVGDSAMRFEATQVSPRFGPLLFVGELAVVADRLEDPDEYAPANLVSLWKDGAPRWYILRFRRSAEGAEYGTAKPRQEIMDNWHEIEIGPSSVHTFEYATAELITDIFGEAVDRRNRTTNESLPD